MLKKKYFIIIAFCLFLMMGICRIYRQEPVRSSVKTKEAHIELLREMNLEQLEREESAYQELNRQWMSQFLEEAKYFPIPISSTNPKQFVSYVNSWGMGRTYGGNRQHEGTDIMADYNVSGYYPVISVSDGVVEKIGWLELGGYRLLIRCQSGGKFYYAHLSGYAEGITEGTKVSAGQLIGYMGDTGYGAEGTTGKFPVHLHFGIYVTYQGEEISVNPYYLLKRLQIIKANY